MQKWPFPVLFVLGKVSGKSWKKSEKDWKNLEESWKEVGFLVHF
jgi:hypothetical protein